MNTIKRHRLRKCSEQEFIELLRAKMIRPAGPDEIGGAFKGEPLYKHPRTRQYFVEVGAGVKVEVRG